MAMTFCPPLNELTKLSGPSFENDLEAVTNIHCFRLCGTCLIVELNNLLLTKFNTFCTLKHSFDWQMRIFGCIVYTLSLLQFNFRINLMWDWCKGFGEKKADWIGTPSSKFTLLLSWLPSFMWLPSEYINSQCVHGLPLKKKIDYITYIKQKIF